MAEVGILCVRTFASGIRTLEVHPIEWVPADSPAPRITLLEAQLDYYTRLLNSAEAGILLTCLPALPLPPDKPDTC
jgi:hypothetical protein